MKALALFLTLWASTQALAECPIFYNVYQEKGGWRLINLCDISDIKSNKGSYTIKLTGETYALHVSQESLDRLLPHLPVVANPQP